MAATSIKSNGSSCLHAACSHSHIEIVRLLLVHGSCRCLNDQNGRTPLDEATIQEIARCFRRPIEAATQRFAANPNQQIEWFFNRGTAETYSWAIGWGSIQDRGVKTTVKKLKHAGILPHDRSGDIKLVRSYFKQAKKTNDSIFLLKAYTVESQFCRELNDYITSHNSRHIYKRLHRKWSGYYTGTIMANPSLESYHFSGKTFRGIKMTPSDVEQYKPGVTLTPKVFQSTTKSDAIALTFAGRENPKSETIPVLVIFIIVDPKSALDVTTISEYQDEQEVLILPGTLFIVENVDKSRKPFECQLRQLVWTDE